ncbi:glycoside hydrolase family 16 protein [Kitasatospora sp. NPDC085879]|uniref:glycoside hydrolase family 16 protein n=1 Tax=Kitasatospora sp. NPDC085879 TaxID=3154769 RepID=UPI0034299159
MPVSAIALKVGAVAGLGLLAVPFLGSAEAASVPEVTQDRLTPVAMAADTAAAASLSVHSSACFTARKIGVAVRDAAGNRLDFPGSARNLRICPDGVTVTTGTRTLPSGTYTAFGTWQDADRRWHDLPAQTLNVRSTGTPAPAPSPTTAPVAPSASPTATPSTTASATPSAPAPSLSASPSASSSPTSTAGAPTWSDDFDGVNVPLGSWTGCSNGSTIATSHCSGLPAAVDSKWWAYPDGWKDTSKNGTYSPSKTMSIANGQMNLHLNRDASGTWVSAPVPKLPAAAGASGVQYGRFEVTWKATSAAGYKMAWLLWPDDGIWPQHGEIDFPEGDLNGSIGAFMHRADATSGSDQDAYSTGVATAGAWHTSAVDWQKDSLTFYLDGKVIGRSTARIPANTMHWVLQSETALNGTVPATGSSADIAIDSVKFWKAS